MTTRNARQLQSDDAQRYEAVFDDLHRAQGILWTLEQDILRSVVEQMRPSPRNALDFACGTGRVLGWLRDRIPESTGLDVSEAMLERAAHRVPGATLVLGDVSTQPDLITGTFDIVTMFRFVLNVEPQERADALSWAARRVSEHGVLIVNVHRNPHSLTGLMARAKRILRRSDVPRTMSLHTAAELLEAHGFAITARYGYGYLPYGSHGSGKVVLARQALALESRLAGKGARARVASHVILVAQRT